MYIHIHVYTYIHLYIYVYIYIFTFIYMFYHTVFLCVNCSFKVDYFVSLELYFMTLLVFNIPGMSPTYSSFKKPRYESQKVYLSTCVISTYSTW